MKVDKQRTFDSVTYIFSSHGTHTLTRVLRDKQKLGLKSLKSQNQSSKQQSTPQHRNNITNTPFVAEAFR